MIVPFFGVLSPASGRPIADAEAPRKRSFFGALPDTALRDVPMSRAERHAFYLAGKSWEPDPIEDIASRPYAFMQRHTP